MTIFSFKRFLPVCATLALLLSVAGCVTTDSHGRGGDRNVLTRSQIQEANITTNAYRAVQRLRPEWLNSRSGRYIPVYVDGSRRGDQVTTLRQISVSNVSRIEFLGSSEATSRFGSGNMNGAIAVHT